MSINLFRPWSLGFFMESESGGPWVGTPTVLIRKAGGSWAAPAGIVQSKGSGVFEVSATNSDQDTEGSLLLYATGVGARATLEWYWVGDSIGWRTGQTGNPMPFPLYDSAGNPKAGAAPTVQLAKAGKPKAAPSLASSITDIGNGWYEFNPGPGDLDTQGELWIAATGSGIPEQAIGFWVSQAPVIPAGGLKGAVGKRLAGLADLAAIVNGRIYPDVLPQSTNQQYPAVTFYIPSADYGHTLLGSDGTRTASVAVSVFGYSSEQLDNATQIIFGAFDGYQGTMSGIKIHSCVTEQEVSTPNPPVTGQSNWLLQQTIFFSVTHEVPRPSNLGE